MTILLTTVETVIINDLGYVEFPHPLIDFELTKEFEDEMVAESQDLAAALAAEKIILKDETGALVDQNGIRLAALTQGSDISQLVLTGDITLSPSSPKIQILDPNGDNRVVTLPSPSIAGTRFYEILNSGSTNHYLDVYDHDDDTEIIVVPGTKIVAISDGSIWHIVFA